MCVCVLGYECRADKTFLFIFDPCSSGKTLKSHLQENKGWQMMLKRGGHTLRNSEYQIVCILPGLMDVESEEYHNAKILTSSDAFILR
jgi:hypothetical protein